MDTSSSNDDEEPKVCTVFSSSSAGPAASSKTVFDTIAFSMPKKDLSPTSSGPPLTAAGTAGSTNPPQGTPFVSTPNLNEIQDQGQKDHNLLIGSGGDSFSTTTQTFSSATATLFSQEPLSPDEGTTNLEDGSTSMIPTFDAVQSQTTITSQADQVTSSLHDLDDTADGERPGGSPLPTPVDIFGEKSTNVAEVTQEFIAEDAVKQLTQEVEGLSLDLTSIQQQGQGEGPSGVSLGYHQDLGNNTGEDAESPIPTANSLFANAPDVPFPVGQFLPPSQPQLSQQAFPPPSSTATAAFFSSNLPHVQSVSAFPAGTEFPQQQQQPQSYGVTQAGQESLDLSPPPLLRSQISPDTTPVDTFSTLSYSTIDAAYDAWIPKEDTRKILMSIATAVHSGTYFPDKLHMTTQGIIYEDDLIDKVGVNMGRIFGEAEASKRKILNADSVTQDDNGLRELIKLGCYRSAINLTKRLLTLYGQGPGKVGQFSKHNPHTLQLWFTRITLLIRIREFAIAESEIDAFKDFDNPDLYYEYYPDSYGGGRRGCMVPFNFRLLAAEILQYSRKHNETIERLAKILKTIHQILKNIEDGVSEDGSGLTIDGERKSASLEIWHKREIRVYYSLANASLFAKDYHNTFKYLTLLCEKDKAKEPQLKSTIGRLFLQTGDLTTASYYLQLAADLRSGDSEAEQVENLVDSGMISIAQGAYPEAYALLQQALIIQPDNFMVTNNMAVCLLYMGKLKDSLALMETTVKNNTPQLLQENVLLNLCTIYELENTDGHKKNSMLKLISEYKGDGINLASLKMPNLI